MSSKIILGIDPGTNIMGYGLIISKEKKISLVDFGEINMSKIKDHYLKPVSYTHLTLPTSR